MCAFQETLLESIQSLHFNLTHALPRDPEMTPQFFQRFRFTAVKAEAAFQYCR
jgi:hypothetical protein